MKILTQTAGPRHTRVLASQQWPRPRCRDRLRIDRNHSAPYFYDGAFTYDCESGHKLHEGGAEQNRKERHHGSGLQEAHQKIQMGDQDVGNNY